MSRSPGQPLSNDRSQRRRHDLLVAAREVFEEQGYAGTTVSAIVRRAGGSRASFYSYFESADTALEFLVRELTDDLFAASMAPLEPGSPQQALESTIRQFMHAYRDRAGLLAVLDQATASNETFRGIRRDIRSRFAVAIDARLAPRWSGRDVSSAAVAVALGGMVEDLARGRYLLGQDLEEEDAIRAAALVWARTIGLPVEPVH